MANPRRSSLNAFNTLKTTLQTAVQQSFDKGNEEILYTKFMGITLTSDLDKRSVLDQVLREHLNRLVAKSTKDIELLESFVTFTIQASRKEISTATMPVVLLGDIFDASTVDQSEKLFTFVEKGLNIWREPLFYQPCKNNMLRMCNDLLRRLSRFQNAYFRGRILIFLAAFFPFYERSGLNIVSEFNLDNETAYGGDEESLDMKEFLSDIEESKSDSKANLDYNLYCKFWSLQDFFRNPNKCFNKVDWKTFTAHTSHVLSAFSSFKLEDLGNAGLPDTLLALKMDEDKRPTGLLELTSKEQYFAKFLTNQKLLELQLSDSNFRRQILMQLLITFHYLGSPVKFKSESQEMKADQKEWIKETTDTIHRLIAETPPEGAAFLDVVKHMMSREEHWNDWKNKGCPSFNPPALPVEDDEGGERKKIPLVRPRRSKKRLGEIMMEASAQGKNFMGHPELSKLWNVCPDNLEACKSKERDFLPSLESYFEEAIQQTDPAAMVEDVYKRVNDENFGWRALRLLARRSPHFFTQGSQPINKLPEYLETMIKKIARDRPELMRAAAAAAARPEPGPIHVETIEVDEGIEDDATDTADVVEEVAKAPAVEEFPGDMLDQIAVEVGAQWRELGKKLGYEPGLLEYFAQQSKSEEERAKYLLNIWSQDDDDATAENLWYTLDGLHLDAAAAIIKAVPPT